MLTLILGAVRPMNPRSTLRETRSTDKVTIRADDFAPTSSSKVMWDPTTHETTSIQAHAGGLSGPRNRRSRSARNSCG